MFNFGLRFGCNRGSNDQIYHSCSTIFDPLGNYAWCGHSCCICSTSCRSIRALRGPVHVVCLDLDSYELYDQFCCSCSSMDHLVIGYNHEQYDRCLCADEIEKISKLLTFHRGQNGPNQIHSRVKTVLFTIASVASISVFFAFPRKVTHLIAFVALLTVAHEITSTAATIPAIAFARVAVKWEKIIEIPLKLTHNHNQCS